MDAVADKPPTVLVVPSFSRVIPGYAPSPDGPNRTRTVPQDIVSGDLRAALYQCAIFGECKQRSLLSPAVRGSTAQVSFAA
jgi:hypothetical protein